MTADREYQRVQIPLLIGYETAEKKEQKISFTTDVAAGGVRFTADQTMNCGDRIKIQIAIPWRQLPLEFMAEVLRADPIRGSISYEIATKFVDIKPDLAEEITKIVHLMQSRLYLHKLLG